MSTCERCRIELGGYVLEGLGPEEVEQVEAHLRECPECRAELEDIAGTPALLALAREAPPRVPERVRDRVVAEASRRHVRRRMISTAASVAVVAALLGAVAGWWLAPSPRPQVAVPLEAAEPYDASGWATFEVVDERVLVRLDVEGLEPLPEPAAYEAWLSTTDDRVLSIGQLDAGPQGSVDARLLASGEPEDYRGFWITAEPDRRDPAHDGPTVLRAPVPPLP